MGKASRWLKSLLGLKKNNQTPPPPPNQTNNKKEKRRWSFTNQRNDSVPPPPPPPRRISLNIPPEGVANSAWLQNYLSEKEHNQAIAMAEATAAAAEAAIAAAQAAMVVVRLNNNINKRRSSSSSGKQRWASVKIQTVFRGYLARKALKALKGLVKLQAHVRGYLVRKRAAATLHSMQALIRAQNTARFLRPPSTNTPPEDEFHSKRMSDSYDDNPKIVEIDTYKPRSIRPNNNSYTFSSEYYDQDIPAFASLSMSGPIGGPFLTPSRRYEWGHRRNSTAHCTPRFRNWANDEGPFTSEKPIWDECPFRTYYRPQPGPNYMASTQSFEAKSRSQSAPKQRLPQPSPSPSKKKMSLEKVMECRHMLTGVRMNRSYSEDRRALRF